MHKLFITGFKCRREVSTDLLTATTDWTNGRNLSAPYQMVVTPETGYYSIVVQCAALAAEKPNWSICTGEIIHISLWVHSPSRTSGKSYPRLELQFLYDQWFRNTMESRNRNTLTESGDPPAKENVKFDPADYLPRRTSRASVSTRSATFVKYWSRCSKSGHSVLPIAQLSRLIENCISEREGRGPNKKNILNNNNQKNEKKKMNSWKLWVWTGLHYEQDERS